MMVANNPLVLRLPLLLLLPATCCMWGQLVDGLYTVPAMAEVYSELAFRVKTQDDFKLYQVQEYMDRRSSGKGGITIRVKDVDTGEFVTYFNSGSDRSTMSVTKFDEEKFQCSLEEDLGAWKLLGLARMIFFMPIEFVHKLNSARAIGTTSLLVLANSLAHHLVLASQGFDKRRQAMLNYYIATFSVPPEEVDFQEMVIKMVVATVEGGVLQGARYADSSGPGAPIRVQLLLMSAKEAEQNASASGWSQFLERSEWELGVTVDYYLVQPIADMNVLGSPILGLNNPLTLPLGIGCWVNRMHEPFEVSRAERFSAQYMLNGKVQHYIAYDRSTETIRVDHWNTKLVYDFRARLVYNVDQGAPVSQEEDGADMQADDTQANLDNEDRVCAVALINDSYSSLMQRGLTGILGFGYRQSPLFRMGSVEYDGFECDVYEREYRAALAPLIFGHIALDPSQKYYLVAYILAEAGESDIGRSYQGLLKRLELRSYLENSKERGLVSTVTFSAFSWSLEVPPFYSKLAPGSLSSQVMSTGECSPARSSQLLLKFTVEPDQRNEMVSKEELAALRRKSALVEERFLDGILERMSISRTRINRMWTRFIDSSLVVSVLMSELQRALFIGTIVGHVDPAAVQNAPKSPKLNLGLISPYECITTAARHKQIKTVAYCGQNGLCALFEQEKSDLFGDRISPVAKEDATNTNDNNNNNSRCDLIGLARKSARDTSYITSEAITVETAKFSAYSLRNYSISFKVSQGSGASAKTGKLYAGIVSNVLAERLDDLRDSETLRGLTFKKFGGGERGDNLVPIEMTPSHGQVFCERACRLDRHCLSYAFCRRPAAAGNQCILAPMSLTRANTDSIIVASKQNQRVDFSDPNGRGQLYRLERDPECGLHRADIMARYKHVADLQVDVTKEGYTVKTLEECALSFHMATEQSADTAASLDSKSKFFHHCPLYSVCQHADQKEAVKTAPQNGDVGSSGNRLLCHRYRYDLSGFYQTSARQRLQLTVDGQPKQDDQLSRRMVGLSELECAAECLYGDPACVSYDRCLSMDYGLTSECFFNRVRTKEYELADKLDESADFVSLSSLERKYYEDKAASARVHLGLAYAPSCSHSHLTKQNIAVKYFNLMYTREKSPEVSSKEVAVLDEALAEKSKTNIEIIKSYLNKLITKKKKRHALAWQFTILVAGILAGIISIVYGPRAWGGAVDACQSYQRRRQQQSQARHSSFSQMDLVQNEQ